MTDRGQQLHATIDQQVAELIDLISPLDEAALRRPCPGREKLGDGTVGASARHTADNYQRIAGFVQTSDRIWPEHGPAQLGAHRIPRLLRALGDGRQGHAPQDNGADEHGNAYTADFAVDAVVEQLGACRDALGRIAELTDSQLDQVPPKDSLRFCDGQRTLEQVLAGLLKHQAHQLEALKTAVG